MKKKVIYGFVFGCLLQLMCGCGTEPEKATGVNPQPMETSESVLSTERVESSTEEIEESKEEVKEPEVVSVVLSFAGDCSLGNHHKQDYVNSFRKEYELQTPDYFMANVADIFAQDDMTLVNYEGVATYYNVCNLGDEYNIKGDPEYVKILTLGNIEAVGLANNHALDYGITGRNDTIKALTEEGITYAYDDVVAIYETKGVRIGYIAFSATGNTLTKELKKKITDGLTTLAEEDADIKIVCLHWGVESQYYPESYQINFGHDVIDLGADVLIGTHPHVLQGIEEYNGKFIVYSLGNFCFGANRSPKDKDTMIFQQTFTFVDGVLQEDTNARIIPCKISSVNERNNYQPTPQTEDEAVRIINRVNEYSKSFNTSFDEEGYYIPN